LGGNVMETGETGDVAEPELAEEPDIAEESDSLQADSLHGGEEGVAMEGEEQEEVAESPFPVQTLKFDGDTPARADDDSADAVVKAVMPEVAEEEGEDADGDADGDGNGDEATPSRKAEGDAGAAGDAESPADASEMPNLPKRATPAFSYFLRDKYGSRPSREAGDAWKALSEEEKAQYTAMHATDKARYDAEKEAYKRYLAEHPELGAAAAAASDELEPAGSVLPLAKVKRMMRLANLTSTTSLAKDAVFMVSKSAETFLQMLTEQSVHFARAGKRKKVNTQDLEHVLYGNRNADLLDFLHGDFPKQARRTTPVKQSKPKSKQSKLAPVDAEADAEAEEGEEGEEPPAGKENAVKRRKGGAAAANAPVQSTNMHSFFGRRSGAEAEEPQREREVRSRVKRAAGGDEMELDMDDALLEDDGDEEATAAAPAHGRKRRLALVSDDDSDEAES